MSSNKPIDSTTPEDVPGFIVYAGQREHSREDICYLFYGFTDENVNHEKTDEENLREWRFGKPLFKRMSIGSVYKCTFKENQIVFSRNDGPIAFWKNNIARVKWQALDNAMNTIKSLKKELADNKLIERLQPIKEAYREAGTQGRRNILSEVIRIITT